MRDIVAQGFAHLLPMLFSSFCRRNRVIDIGKSTGFNQRAILTHIFHMKNDVLVVYGRDGNIRNDLGGQFDAVLIRVLARCTSSTKFFVQGVTFPVSRELFETKDYWNQIWGKS